MATQFGFAAFQSLGGRLFAARGVQTYTDFYGLVRTLAAVSTAATIGELTLVVGGVGLVGGICRQYKTLLAPNRRPLDCYRRLRTHPYPVPVGGQTALFQ